MKYLRKFETQAAYEAAQSGLILPNVSLIVDNNVVHYNPSTPTPSHDYVEIGGTKWATMNIGANSITDTGLYFQWGDTQGYTAAQVGSGSGQKYFDNSTYKFYDNGSYTKYNSTDRKTVLDLEDDAVQAAWGGNWRMPTANELQALGAAVNTAWTADYEGSGVAGLVCADKTDSSKVLFFPACGRADGNSVDNIGENGYYWLNSCSVSMASNASQLYFDYTMADWSNTMYKSKGNTIRGVLDDSNS